MRTRFVRVGLLGAGLTAAALFAAASPAAAFVPDAPTFVDCHHATIDPPAGAVITFYGTIGGVNVGLPATRIPNTVFTAADITAYTGGTGPIPYTLIPYWQVAPNPYGVTSGFGPVAKGVLHCHDAPPPTTVSTTSTTIATTDQRVKAPPTTAPGKPVPPELPRTGSSTLPFALLGGAFVLSGSALMWRGRQRRRHAR